LSGEKYLTFASIRANKGYLANQQAISSDTEDTAPELVQNFFEKSLNKRLFNGKSTLQS